MCDITVRAISKTPGYDNFYKCFFLFTVTMFVSAATAASAVENDYIHGGRGNVRDVHDVRECRGGYDVS